MPINFFWSLLSCELSRLANQTVLRFRLVSNCPVCEACFHHIPAPETKKNWDMKKKSSVSEPFGESCAIWSIFKSNLTYYIHTPRIPYHRRFILYLNVEKTIKDCLLPCTNLMFLTVRTLTHGWKLPNFSFSRIIKCSLLPEKPSMAEFRFEIVW